MKYFLLSFLFGCLIAYTQTDTPEVTYEDLNATSCPIDAEASAYYIYEKGSSFINLTTFELVTNYQARIKILNKNAFRVGNITITLQKTKNGTENLSELTGKTYNLENNTIVSHTLDKEHVYIDDSNQYIKLVKFSLPNIKKGSIIEYHYTKKSPFVFNFKNWNFQDYIPKLYSQYDTKIPAIFQYRKKLLGYLDFETHTAEIESNCINQGKVKSDCAIETYAMKNIPAFKEESFMLSPENYISQLEFELLSTDWINGKKHYTKEWNDIDQDLRFNYSLGKEAKSKANFKDAVTQEIKDLEYNLIKAKRIYYYLQNILLWNKKVDVFKAFDLKKTLEDKIGSSTELNMILLNTLKAYGFDAKIMLLSTRANGKVTKLHPSISEFNYMIVNLVIQGQTHLLDISNKFKKFGDLPFKCYNHYGRVMDFKKGSYWQDIIPKNKLIRNSDIHFTIEDDLVKGHARIKNEGFISSSKRAMYFKNKEKYLKYFENGGTIQLLDYKEQNLFKVEKTYTELIDFEIEAEEIGGDIYFNPFVYNMYTSNPFQLKERKYPVDFGKLQQYSTQIFFTIPEGYSAEINTKNQVIATNDNALSFKIDLKQSNKTLYLTKIISINKTSVAAKQYEELKRVFQAILDVQSNTILVLKKNKY